LSSIYIRLAYLFYHGCVKEEEAAEDAQPQAQEAQKEDEGDEEKVE